jgi:sulfur-oxidizing protein SoxX
MKYRVPLIALVVIGILVACDSGPRSPVGFRLPEGDVLRGQVAFEELKCHRCHRVAGVEDLSEVTLELVPPLVLGGKVFEVRTDGYLVTSIIYPSHRLAPGFRKADITTADEESRMPIHNESMTVSQLIDLVAFLQAHYQVVPPPRPMN